MQLRHILLKLLATLCFITPQICFAEQLDNKVIERIDVVFVNESSDSEYNAHNVLARLRSREGDIFSQTDFDNDLKILAQEYDHVEPEVEVIDTNLYITLKVWPKPVIHSICFEGNCKVKTSTLQSELCLRAGTLFDRVEFNRAFQKVRAYYIKKGYFEADLDYSIETDDCNQVYITVCVNEGRSGKIKDIVFCGFTSCERDELLECMITKEYNIFTSWLNDTGTYNEDAIQIDQYRMLTYLQDKGYADAEVDIEVCEARQKDRIVIYIRACKGERYCFGPISFEGNCIFSDEDILSRFTISEGCPYSPQAIRETVNCITTLYGKYGYIEAIVDYESRLIDGENAYTLHLKIEEGEQYRVGLVRVYGNHKTQSRVILHESLLIPGEVFNIDKLRKTEEKLTNIGYFDCVNVYIAQTNDLFGEECRYRDVNIEVDECGTGHFGAFFGFSTAESLFGGVTITEKNFDHVGLGQVWDRGLGCLRGGGEFLHFTVNVGQKATSYGMSWTQPFFCDTKWSIGFDIERSITRYVSDEYDIDSIGGAFHATYPLDQFLRFGWHYRLRYTDSDVCGYENNVVFRQEADSSGLISASGVSLTYDSTNSPNCPTDGFRSRMELEYAGIGGDAAFVGFAYLNTWYWSPWKKGVLKLRADGRLVKPSGSTTKDDVPIDERIFLGGDNAIRGFRPYAIGPKFPLTDEPRGGYSMYLLSSEYQHKMWDRMDGFLFVDAGQLSRAVPHLDSPYVSAGFGIRLKIFENGPPLTTGFGIPLNPKSNSDVKRFFWSIGGRF